MSQLETVYLGTSLYLSIMLCLAIVGLYRERHERKRQKAIADAWKEFGIAVELVFDLNIDKSDYEVDSVLWQRLDDQQEHAEETVVAALLRLRELGEYLDAYQCSPFLPPTDSYERTLILLRHNEERHG